MFRGFTDDDAYAMHEQGAPIPVIEVEVIELNPPTVDDFVSFYTAKLTELGEVAIRIAKLLNGDAGRTIADIAEIIDQDEMTIAFCFGILTNGGAVFTTFPTATGETGYNLLVLPLAMRD